MLGRGVDPHIDAVRVGQIESAVHRLDDQLAGRRALPDGREGVRDDDLANARRRRRPDERRRPGAGRPAVLRGDARPGEDVSVSDVAVERDGTGGPIVTDGAGDRLHIADAGREGATRDRPFGAVVLSAVGLGLLRSGVAPPV